MPLRVVAVGNGVLLVADCESTFPPKRYSSPRVDVSQPWWEATSRLPYCGGGVAYEFSIRLGPCVPAGPWAMIVSSLVILALLLLLLALFVLLALLVAPRERDRVWQTRIGPCDGPHYLCLLGAGAEYSFFRHGLVGSCPTRDHKIPFGVCCWLRRPRPRLGQTTRDEMLVGPRLLLEGSTQSQKERVARWESLLYIQELMTVP